MVQNRCVLYSWTNIFPRFSHPSLRCVLYKCAYYIRIFTVCSEQRQQQRLRPVNVCGVEWWTFTRPATRRHFNMFWLVIMWILCVAGSINRFNTSCHTQTTLSSFSSVTSIFLQLYFKPALHIPSNVHISYPQVLWLPLSQHFVIDLHLVWQ